jgi:homospermidine synthase
VYRKEAVFRGRLVITGFGSIGQAALPLLLRHIEMRPDQVLVINAHADDAPLAEALGVQHLTAPLREDNFRRVLGPHLDKGDFLLNLSVEVSSTALMQHCREVGALYLDTCTEPWPGRYADPTRAASERTNYALREAALALRGPGPAPTAVITHGANPGLVSHFVKQALLNIAQDTGCDSSMPATRQEWAGLAQRLGIRVIHIAERDTQWSYERKRPGEFVNTWSVQGFIEESLQPSELGWGSHERRFPADGARHNSGCRASIYLSRPGAATRVRSWAPLAGPFHGFLVTHAESTSIAHYLTIGAATQPSYRPTVLYAYHPCDDAVLSLHELAGRNWRPQDVQRLIRDDIASGRDELGVLLMGHAKNAYWFGSQLTAEEAREACPYNSATSLQVAAPVMAGVIWAIRNPEASVVEPEELPFDEILQLCKPYLGELRGAYSDWSPLVDRGELFEEEVDRADPWQFGNFRVT